MPIECTAIAARFRQGDFRSEFPGARVGALKVRSEAVETLAGARLGDSLRRQLVPLVHNLLGDLGSA